MISIRRLRCFFLPDFRFAIDASMFSPFLSLRLRRHLFFDIIFAAADAAFIFATLISFLSLSMPFLLLFFSLFFVMIDAIMPLFAFRH